MRARSYDPETQQFLSRDPVGIANQQYVYANPNPINYIDPTGTQAVPGEGGDIEPIPGEGLGEEPAAVPGGGGGAAAANAAENAAEVESAVRANVPESHQADILNAFEPGSARLETAPEDITAMRYTSKGYKGIARWFATKIYQRAGNARRYLALPANNTAEEAREYTIPAGTTYLRGKAASQVDNTPAFGSYAVGGGEQIYLFDPAVAIEGRQLR